MEDKVSFTPPFEHQLIFTEPHVSLFSFCLWLEFVSDPDGDEQEGGIVNHLVMGVTRPSNLGSSYPLSINDSAWSSGSTYTSISVPF